MKSVILTLIVGLLIAGCSSNNVAESPIGDEFTYVRESSADPGVAITVRGEASNLKIRELADENNDRSIIYQAYFRISALYPDSVHARVARMAEDMEGFVLESAKEQTVIRVPVTRLDEATVNIEQLGKVIDKKVIGEDVTDKHFDLKIRLENALKSRDRYLDLLEKAVSVEDILRVEKELDRLNREIDQLKGKLNRMTHMIDYVKIAVRTTPGTRPGPVGWVFYQAYKGLKWLVVRD